MNVNNNKKLLKKKSAVEENNNVGVICKSCDLQPLMRSAEETRALIFFSK